MAGTRTAPAIDGTPPWQNVSFHFIDNTEDSRAISGQFPPDTTAAQIEAIAAALQTRSNASLYRVDVTSSYSSQPDPGNADPVVHLSVYDNVVLLFKDQLNHSQNFFIPAPTEAVQPDNSDTPDTAQLLALGIVIVNALEEGTTDDWQVISARFTERREKNQRTFM